MDALGWGCLGVSLVATAGAVVAGARGRTALALVLLMGVVGARDLDLIWHHWLSPWDERVHAVVARHMIEHPLRPTLVERPLEDARPGDWMHTRIWLHKPPLALWLMAGSMRLLGPSEVAARVPSWILGIAAVGFTFGIARRFFGPGVSLAAAGFHAWNGRWGLAVGGLRATDHVDAVLWALVGLGTWLGLLAADAAAEGRRRRAVALTVATGVVLGLALLTKDLPALVIAGVVGLRLLTREVPWRWRLGLPAAVVALGAAVALPWQLYTAWAFPVEAAANAGRAALRFSHVVEEHAEPWWFFLGRLARSFSNGASVAVPALLVAAFGWRRDWIPLAGWWLATYAVFSAAATKLEGYVFVAAPVVFCALGWVCVEGLRGLPRAWRERDPWRGAAAAAGLFMLTSYAVGPAFAAQQLGDPLPRRMTWTEELRYLAGRLRALPPGPWVVFAVPSPIEAMFYADVTAVSEPPDRGRLALADERGLRVAVYGDRRDPALRAAASRPDVRFLPPDPRTAAQRSLRRWLAPRVEHRGLVFNARAPQDLEAYLEQRIPGIDVLARLPDPDDHKTARALRRKEPLFVLVGADGLPGREALEAALPGLEFVAAPDLAR